MAEGAIFEVSFLYFRLVHFMPAGLATVVVSRCDGLPAHYAGWEIAATAAAGCVVLAHRLFAVLSWAFYQLPWGLLRGMLREDAHRHVDVLLALLRGAHAFQFHESSRTLFVTLNLSRSVLCCNRLKGRPVCKSSWRPCPVRTRSASTQS